MLALSHTASESTEDRFRSVFGARRTSSWHPCGVRELRTSDFDNCHAVELANDQITLHCRPEALEPWEPFLWVTRDGDPDPTYLASIDAWRHDTSRQMRHLARALCREQLMDSNDIPEWDAKTRRDREYLRIAAEYARVITLLPYSCIAFWQREEFADDPVATCMALVQALQGSWH